MYVAVIGDIINSKNIKNREEIQNRLKAVLVQSYELHREDFSSAPTITLGDEFQFLLRTGTSLMKLIDFINRKMAPVELRIGIGYGEILTEINPEISIGADGPAYWYAREALQILKTSRDRRIGIYGKTLYDDILNQIIILIELIERDWTSSQKQFVQLITDLDGFEQMSQIQLAEALQVSPQLVNKKLKGLHLIQLNASKESLAVFLTKILQNEEVENV